MPRETEFQKSKRFFVAIGIDMLDEWGMKVGTIENAATPATRVFRFFDDRLFTQPQSPHDVHFSDGKSQRHIGSWRMEKAVKDD